jgi:SAM-dependent methyltransferase
LPAARAAAYRFGVPRGARSLESYNRAFYERCWRAGTVLRMPGVAPARERTLELEIGSGLRPRLPLDRAVFVDLSRTACTKLARAGARTVCASIARLPFARASVGAIQAYEVLEHLDDDAVAVGELARVLAPGGRLVVSTPLHGDRWHAFDRIVGHARRYEPAALVALMESHGFALDGFAPFGMRPRSRILTRLGAYFMERWPRVAFRYEERFLRRMHADDAVVIVRHADAATFLREAAALDGTVTAWVRAATGQPAIVRPPDTLSTCPVT